MKWGAKLERFIEAFDSRTGSCHRACACGRDFINPEGGWGFIEGEIEEAVKNGATELDHSVVCLEFEGSVYVQDCNCWHERAERIMKFLDSHHDKVANYLNGEIKAAHEWADARKRVET